MEEVKTSESWFKFLNPDYIIADPDGWDRRNWEYSWYEELITLKEFERRVGMSTLFGRRRPSQIEILKNEIENTEGVIITDGLAMGKYNMGFYTDGPALEHGRVYKVILIPTKEFYDFPSTKFKIANERRIKKCIHCVISICHRSKQEFSQDMPLII